ncbi:Uncharacterized protein OS=Sorangium cellulosum (strain So ce56) GN=sce5710 PE=4 SV=1 [Gemmata massiliana]|uniref:Uncharacterized protein n=1 Tax=Gemmata massiliana TaxID=1210884 RepID=A0A6P2D916_9BACT|nr:hypothetical protein [Gemmata massiliana]VTR97841.1 Uncharacterized protein OS=Sorangium cellulosum (strain So ce56) GN=sce5710 PE=4 SV=1 [Gemmata massiliana]
MTEEEWLESIDPMHLWVSLDRNASNRKRRLFGCACCRRIWPLIPDARCRSAVITAEQFADGDVSRAELARAKAQAKAASVEHSGAKAHARATSAEQWGRVLTKHWAAGACCSVALAKASDVVMAGRSAAVAQQTHAVLQLGRPFGSPESAAMTDQLAEQEQRAQADLLRDIFGNPFRPVPFSLGARTPQWQ